MKTLGEFLIANQQRIQGSTGEFSKVIHALRLASKVVSHEVNKAGLVDILGEVGTTNIQGESQQKLDVFAHELFIKALTNRKIVCGIASEEADDYIQVKHPASDENSKYIVLIDPLDGSSNIDVNVSLGTIFSIYKKKSKGNEVVLEDFLQAGTEQVAAGYILYGTSTLFVYTTGQGVNGFTLNPAIGTFYLSHPNITLPPEGHIYSINEANYASFPQSVKDFLKKRKAEDLNYTTRYIGSMVADIHRNMLKGGLFLYPPNAKSPNGKLRLLYECNPIAFIVEQAGGMAVNMDKRIMEINPKSLHQREPFFCGNREMVENLLEHLQK
ncbi:class 1 fructose-bisphosphatase [Flavobacteriaceae bacterium]|jgi:fructose-1,6-bisphosphatase I|nr:class 1 fructose-bisphosphatase [Flavobacteriaceae bacterium]